MQVKGGDEEVNDRCGTKGWVAPEVEKEVMYSPIKADRWSCGHILLYLLDKSRKDYLPLRTIGRKPSSGRRYFNVVVLLSTAFGRWRHKEY